MKVRHYLAIFLAGTANYAFSAGVSTGNDWKALCDSRHVNDQLACFEVINATVQGLAVGFLTSEELHLERALEEDLGRKLTEEELAEVKAWSFFCPPDGVTTAQVRDVVLKNVNDYPASRNRRLANIAFLSLASTWPCENGVPKAAP